MGHPTNLNDGRGEHGFALGLFDKAIEKAEAGE
jgi:hypothetical protein